MSKILKSYKNKCLIDLKKNKYIIVDYKDLVSFYKDNKISIKKVFFKFGYLILEINEKNELISFDKKVLNSADIERAKEFLYSLLGIHNYYKDDISFWAFHTPFEINTKKYEVDGVFIEHFKDSISFKFDMEKMIIGVELALNKIYESPCEDAFIYLESQKFENRNPEELFQDIFLKPSKNIIIEIKSDSSYNFEVDKGIIVYFDDKNSYSRERLNKILSQSYNAHQKI